MKAPDALHYILWRYGQDHRGEDHQQRLATVQEWLATLEAPKDEPQLDWPKAKAYLDQVQRNYEELPGGVGRFGLAITIMPLQDRYERGERTEWLYNEIMELN